MTEISQQWWFTGTCAIDSHSRLQWSCVMTAVLVLLENLTYATPSVTLHFVFASHKYWYANGCLKGVSTSVYGQLWNWAQASVPQWLKCIKQNRRMCGFINLKKRMHISTFVRTQSFSRASTKCIWHQESNNLTYAQLKCWISHFLVVYFPSFSLFSSITLHVSICFFVSLLCVFLFFFFLSCLSPSAIQKPAVSQPASLFLLALFLFHSLTHFLLAAPSPFSLCHIPACFCLSFSTPSIMLSVFCSPLPGSLSLAVPLLSYLLVYLCVCVCTDNSLAGSVHRYSRPRRAPLFILSCSSSTTAQEEG